MNKPSRLLMLSLAGFIVMSGYALVAFPARAAAPKRLLLVTTTVGFRHAAVPLQEHVFRELAKSTGEFTIVSTTDSPDYPAAEYKATVDQRNARIPLSEAKDNNMPPPPRAAPAGGGGGAGRGGAARGVGGGRSTSGPDPIAGKVAKVLQQYMSIEALKNYDAVAFLSTTGELPIPDTDAFLKWIAEGHAFIGLHSATDTLHQTPEYIKMIGGEFDRHGAFHPAVPVMNMDSTSPIMAGWGQSVTIDEEFYLFKNFDPKQVRLLLAMPYQPYTTDKQPGEFPVSWIKMYGRGRVFYTSLGHRDDVLLPDATIGDQEFKVRYNQAEVATAVQKHILNGVRWALGLIQADVTPQAR